MSSPFAITAATNTVSLDSQRQGQASFTVSNTETQAISGRGHVVPLSTAAGPWLTLAGTPERDFARSESQQYVVQIAVPPTAPAGDYTFRLDVVDVADPDDNLSEGPTVKFTVPEPVVVKKPFPWWIVAVAVAAVLVVGGGIYGLIRVLNPPPVACLQASPHSLIMTGVEAGGPLTQKVTLRNCGSAGHWTSAIKTSNNLSWLKLDATTGTLAAGAKQDIQVTINDLVAFSGASAGAPRTFDRAIPLAPLSGCGCLLAGTYTGTLTFTTGSNATVVPITFIVQRAPTVTPSPLSMAALSNRDAVTQIQLTNNGDAGTVSATAVTDDGTNWLEVSLPSGTPIGAGSTLPITVIAHGANFFSGIHTGHITFTIQSKAITTTVTVAVSFRVVPSFRL